MRCAKSQKLYNMTTVPLQICNGTNRCCKIFIILYSHFSLLSLHFFFSLRSHSSVPSPFSLCRFPPSSTNSGCSPSTTTAQLQRRRRSSNNDSALCHTRSRSSHSISPTLQPLDLTHAQPRLIPPISPRHHHRSHAQPRSSHSTSLWLWVFFFFSLQFGLI